MKKVGLVFFLAVFFLLPSFAQSQPDKMLKQFFDKGGARIRPDDLQVRELEMSPDPVRQGQPMGFQVTIANSSNRSGRVNLSIRDKDEIIAQASDVTLRPGTNRIDFPQTRYKFERNDHCFTVEVDIEGNRSPIDEAKEFCARRTARGWSLNAHVCRRPVYRAYQTQTADHLYTIDEQEAFALPPVWIHEGKPFFACDSPAEPDMVEIKRYYSWTNTDHYYLPANQQPPYGYNSEGTAFWIFRKERPDLVPLFLARLRGGTDTILTIDPSEVVSLRNEPSWNVKGIIGYVRPYDSR